MNRGQISNLLRKLGLSQSADRMRYYIQRYKNRKANQDFRAKHPLTKLPPDYLIYESFQINYQKYFNGGLKTAKWLAKHFNKHIELNDKRILDWGCGPGRIIRHLPTVINNDCEYFGTDYNKKSIDWCAKNLPGISFNCNTSAATLPYVDNFFDIIYGISIFTHLSEQMHYDWYNELFRILKPNGIILLTTQGDNFKVKLTSDELKKYNENELITRGNVKEGHRTYSAFQPSGFMIKLFDGVKILEHVEITPENEDWIPQDIWIIKK